MSPKAAFAAALAGALLLLPVPGAGFAQPSLEHARRQPIDMGVEAIHLIIARRPPGSVILAFPGSAALWWYRKAGIVLFPGETVGNDRNETRFIVLNPYLSPDDLVRLIADR